MKVLLLNGSPRKNGCTYTALNVVADALKAEGIETEVFQAGDPDMENVKAAAAKLKDS
uniref:NAD(P)H-dependent oxidoreductase n=1 Tax=Enterocloster sp. TaxID=2719315 RepID=UPI003FEDED27